MKYLVCSTQNRRLAVALAAAAALTLSGCGGGSSQEIVEDGSATAASTADSATIASEAVGRTASSVATATGGVDLTEEQVASATAAYQRFLALYDEARMGNEVARSELAEVGPPVMLAMVDDWIGANQVDGLDGVLRLTNLESVPNVVTVTGDSTEVVIADCVEEMLYRDPIPPAEHFIDQVVTLTADGDDWQVTNIDVRTDGRPVTNQDLLGCVPAHYIEGIEASTEAFLAAERQAQADPSAGIPPELAEMVGGIYRTYTEQVLEWLASSGNYRDLRKTERTIEVLGSDLNALGNAFVVGVCTRFPEGFALRKIGTDEVVEEVEPGALVYGDYTMRYYYNDELELTPQFVDYEVSDTNPDCPTGYVTG